MLYDMMPHNYIFSHKNLAHNQLFICSKYLSNKKKCKKKYVQGFQDFPLLQSALTKSKWKTKSNGWSARFRCPGISAVSPILLIRQGCEFSNNMRYSELSFLFFFYVQWPTTYTYTKKRKTHNLYFSKYPWTKIKFYFSMLYLQSKEKNL